jgi:site-specific DNA-methyltransferase (adenine-specific)/site-specific DNA-methyltransferase (cytosine-N4-specific)
MRLDTIVYGDCLDVLPTIPDQSVDAVITDPPYPHIKRDYGYWTVEEWWALIVEGVIPEVRRILKPTGSAVFILQPNSEKVGKMRGWLWEFMAWVCREWNMVQDVWWWNYVALPVGGIYMGLTRPSIKPCVWAGNKDCYRDQSAVMIQASDTAKMDKRIKRMSSPSGRIVVKETINKRAKERGVSTPFNLIPIANSAGAHGHGAGTPLALADWWMRYIVPPGGVAVDPFMGSGTMAVAAVKNRCHFFGCDTVQDYVDIANERIAKARLEMAQLQLDITPEQGG